MSVFTEAARQIRYMMAPLDQWRFDPGVDEICINKPNEVFVRKGGRFKRHEIDLDYDTCYDIAVLAGAYGEQNASSSMPLVGGDLPDGERFQGVLPPCVPPGAVSLTIRKPGSKVATPQEATQRYKLDKWNKWVAREEVQRAAHTRVLAAYDSGDIVTFLEEIVRLKLGIILCGHTGSGKTTMLKTILSIISPNERIITIENALEVDIVNQPNHVRLLYSHGGQSVSNVTQKELLQAYLRMRADRGCVGELRDPEAAYTYVSECMTGHPGSPSTIHGRDAKQAAVRLFNLFKASPEGRSFSDEMIKAQLGLVVDVIIPFREHDGQYEIGEVWLGADAERRGTDITELL
jgi:type IV secretion system protein VirB11